MNTGGLTRLELSLGQCPCGEKPETRYSWLRLQPQVSIVGSSAHGSRVVADRQYHMPHWVTGTWVLPVPGYLLLADIRVWFMSVT